MILQVLEQQKIEEGAIEEMRSTIQLVVNEGVSEVLRIEQWCQTDWLMKLP